MVHVLREVHKSLRPRGVLLDVHPQPRHPSVEVWRDEVRLPIGFLDDTVGIRQIQAARASLNALVREHLLAVEARRWFDGVTHYSSVDDWLHRREERGSTSVIPDGMLDHLRAEMRVRGTTLVIGQRVRATRLRRLHHE